MPYTQSTTSRNHSQPQGAQAEEQLNGQPNAQPQRAQQPKQASSTSSSARSARTKLAIVGITVAIMVVLALVSAFAWPGWAVHKAPARQTVAQEEPATPSIPAKPLPQNSSNLMKSLPDAVKNYARTDVTASTQWASSQPTEEYKVEYTANLPGKGTRVVTATVGQWGDEAAAKKQYQSLADAMTGDELGAGDVKVDGKLVGKYVVRVDASAPGAARAVWQNSTAVFALSGPQTSVQRLFEHFPM